MSEVKGLSFFSGEIGYTFIPKVACTSIKLGFYKLQKGYSFNSEDNGCSIHEYYNKRIADISSCKIKLLVVRDPFQRF